LFVLFCFGAGLVVKPVIYNPGYSGGGGRKIMNSRPAWGKLARPYFKNKKKKGLGEWLTR
jgi:hypothetical protein